MEQQIEIRAKQECRNGIWVPLAFTKRSSKNQATVPSGPNRLKAFAGTKTITEAKENTDKD